jgi:hypothetical protein
VVGEAEHVACLVAEAFQQVAGRGLLASGGSGAQRQPGGDAPVVVLLVEQQRFGADPGDSAASHALGLAVQACQGPADLLVPLLFRVVLLGGGQLAD